MSATDAVDERQRITRSAPTAHRVAVAVIAARVAFDPLGFGGRRAGVWEDALARAPTRVDEDPARCARDERAAHAKCAVDALAGGGTRERSATETTRALRAALEDATASETNEDATERAARDAIVRWGLERFLDELMEVSESLDDLEAFFEDARCVAANARAEDYEAEYGFETRDVEGWTPIGMFLKRCYLGFNLLPFEATLTLLDEVRAYAEEVARAIQGDENEPPSGRTCAAPDVLTTLVTRAVEAYDTHAVDADRVLPPDALEDLRDLAPEVPTLHYLRHAAALRRKDYPAAVEHLHRHFDISGEHNELRADLGGDSVLVGGFESANAGRERLQTALLALASTQLAFSHADEATFAISEAVRTAQQNGDEASLAHALALTTALLSRAPLDASSHRASHQDEQLPTLLRRLTAQAAELASPHLIAYASLALTKYAIDNPSRALGSHSHAPGGGALSRAARGGVDIVTTPALATRNLDDIELTRHFTQLVSATPASAASLALARESSGDGVLGAGNDLYPPPKGFASTPTCGYTLSATATALRSLTGTASTLAAEGWSTYGCKYIGRLYAVRQLYLDREASADETATSCATLIAAASECEGVEAADEVCRHVEEIFGKDGCENKFSALAFLRLHYDRAVGVGSYATARRAAQRMLAVIDAKSGADNAAYFEARRMNANLDRLMKNFDDAQKELNALIADAEKVKDEHAAMWAKISLAETHLSAGAPTLALMRALPLELEASESGVEPIQTRALCIMCESWLELGNSHAQLARDALDARALELLSSDDLRLQARAYVACARALIATTVDSGHASIASRVIDALERAAERYAKLGAHRDAAMTYARLAKARAQFDMDTVAAAAKCREHANASLYFAT